MISWIVLTPIIGMVIVACLRHAEIIRWVTLSITLLTVGLTAGLWASFDYTAGGMQFVDRVPFPLGFFEYAVGVDGISLPLVFLTTFITPLCVLVSWRIDSTKAFMLLILLVELAVTGVFTSMDAFLFLLFWELAMIPMYFVIAFWGGPKRVHAAIKFLSENRNVDSPHGAFIRTQIGTTAGVRVTSYDSDMPGYKVFVYELNEKSLKVLDDLLAGKNPTIAFNRHASGLGSTFVVDLSVADTTSDGAGGVKRSHSSAASEGFLQCFGELVSSWKEE